MQQICQYITICLQHLFIAIIIQCFPASKYALNKSGFSYSNQDEGSGSDSHYNVIEKTSNLLEEYGHLKYLDYHNYMGKLKKMRRKADYSVEVIKTFETTSARNWAKQLITHFKYHHSKMTPQKYIIEKIKELQLLPLNSCIKIRYAYDKVTNFHIIEVFLKLQDEATMLI